jgi:hypothetical protein
VTPADVEDLKQRLQASRGRLLTAIAGVTEDQFKRRPEAPDGTRDWSIAETLAHLLAAERLWSQRVEAAMETDGAAVIASQSDWNEEQSKLGRLAPVPQLVHGLLAAQRQMQLLIERASETPGAFERAVEHSTRGRLNVREMLDRFGIVVIDEHAAQIEALRAVVGAKAV